MFGEKLKLIRKGNKIKQKELAVTLGLSQAHFCQLENEKAMPTIDTLNKWCNALKCEVILVMR